MDVLQEQQVKLAKKMAEQQKAMQDSNSKVGSARKDVADIVEKLAVLDALLAVARPCPGGTSSPVKSGLPSLEKIYPSSQLRLCGHQLSP